MFDVNHKLVEQHKKSFVDSMQQMNQVRNVIFVNHVHQQHQIYPMKQDKIIVLMNYFIEEKLLFRLENKYLRIDYRCNRIAT
jgi:hypothetical protein